MTRHHITNYTLVRSSKKNLSLHIKNNTLIARAPLMMPISEIDNFVIKKQQWITKHLNAQQRPTAKQYTTGETFLYLGDEYPLMVTSDELYFDGKNFIGSATQGSFLQLYKHHFANILDERLPYFADTYNFTYNQVRIKAQKTRWGSCSAVNNLNFNYLLMMTPKAVIDSVIVHELCHTVHKNHGKEFWKLVYSIMPEYQTHHNYLKDNTAIINNVYFS